MKLTDKTKKRLTLTGLGVVCVVLVIAISSQFKTEKPVDVPIQPSPTMSVVVNPSAEPPTSTAAPTTKPDVSVSPIDPTATATPVVTAGTDTADSSGKDQSLQAEPTKPAAPTEKPTPKPETSTKDTSKAPEYKPEDTVKTEPSSPKAGDINDKGQMWVPGFGWVDDSGPNQGTVVDGEGDIDKQVGNMD